MSRWTLFERIRSNPGLLQQMLGASCAVGISANLGSPIGGVLFSIEGKKILGNFSYPSNEHLLPREKLLVFFFIFSMWRNHVSLGL
jgi:hypothetical protein